MNAIIDLTARAVSFITAIQTTLLRGSIISGRELDKISILNISPKDFYKTFEYFIDLESNPKSEEYNKSEEDCFNIRAVELVWVSRKKIDKLLSVKYAFSLCVNLVEWLSENEKYGINNMLEQCGGYPTPSNWRKMINEILYHHSEERVNLARALQYMPIQIVLALGAGNCSPREQRIMQIWGANDYKDELLSKDEVKLLDKFKDLEEKFEVDTETLLKDNTEILLKDDDKLLNYLIKRKVPLSFENIFKLELEEIMKNRSRRESEQCITTTNKNILIHEKGHLKIIDPFEKGREMELYALTLSGGGIRSATFNLGVLQGLAKKNLITKFDYLSTVSGGGYIGTWLAAWIKRDGSVVKVSNRLCPDKSPNPLGEELRPIRWLRMFSNYFAPNASIMSVDSWTVGITWLRNTLINQIIIFLLLLSVLFMGNLLFEFWGTDIRHIIYSSWQPVLYWSSAFLIPVSLLAGLGMHAYHSESFSENFRLTRVRKEDTSIISYLIAVVAIIGAYLISAWLSSLWYNNNILCNSIYCKIKNLLPAAIIAFISMLIIAYFGKYYNCIKQFRNSLSFAWTYLIITAAISSIIGLLLLVFVWSILENVGTIPNTIISPWRDELQFIIGVPLTLEAFSITVVARMALLGRYFPDERREWWGRMGAFIHRFSFLWILIAASALLGKEFMHYLFKNYFSAAITAAGGWMALIGLTVKAAFSSTTSEGKNDKSYFNKFLNILSLAGPYLFAMGLLIFLPGLIHPIFSLESKIFTDLKLHQPRHEWGIIFIILIALFCAFILSWRIGVNEFSMHHFYRNRLVRAFLGATRRSTDRQRTYNPFTGFDMQDDEKLYKMKHEFGYYGPYPILNTALNASEVIDLDRQDRKAESFIFSPLYCGFDFSMIKASADLRIRSYDYAFRETKEYAFKDEGPSIGTAMAISGAAINPNQGYHSSAATAFLLTVFNVQMGRWIGNPRKRTWQCSDPKFGLGCIFSNLVGRTNTRNDFISLSDGGHFDNMGLYEMIRRRCCRIVVCDAEQDNDFTCEGFANAIRRCRIDFGAEIEIDISDIVKRTEARYSKVYYVIGDIKYLDNTAGKLLYIKSSLTGKEPVDVYEYSMKNTTFPQQTTADQFFDEEQFESYRKLGLHIANNALKDTKVLDFFNLPTNNVPANGTLYEKFKSDFNSFIDKTKSFLSLK